MRFFTRSLALTGLLMVTALVQAQTASEKLADLLSGYETFSARFAQYSSNTNGRRSQESSGEMQLAKPDRFYWNTLKPFPQTIVGDGEYIWVYDPDLEQVTRKSGDGNSNAPAMLLNGQLEQLDKDFVITNPVNTGNEALFDLAPRDKEGSEGGSGFARIRLFFVSNLLTELMLEDHLGQRTTVLLQDQQRNPSLADDHFRFTPPEGVDVIFEDAL
ncbi:MAG: outer membrane lipoprotein chaperone LolA [Marinobacterium sp.]|nr:outer membrane lipoprotein chaperone LolA [Marinobacterium sp.]